jgi:hypothetical protein
LFSGFKTVDVLKSWFSEPLLLWEIWKSACLAQNFQTLMFKWFNRLATTTAKDTGGEIWKSAYFAQNFETLMFN